MLIGPDQGHHAQHGQQRRGTRERCAVVIAEHGNKNQPHAQQADSLRCRRGQALLAGRRNRQHGTGQQFPCPHRQQEKRFLGMLGHGPDAEPERHQQQAEQSQPPVFESAGQQGQQQGKDNIELFLNRQRPGMQQRF